MVRALSVVAAGGAAALLYGTQVEYHAYTVRRHRVPVLAPGADPIRVLHISDCHMTPPQQRKQNWIRGLADLRPDVVLNTGDTLSSPLGIPAVMHALGPLLDTPGAFVPGNNDYFEPKPKNPMRYFFPKTNVKHGPPLPWPELSAAMSRGGWLDLTHRHGAVTVDGARVALAGTDDPHLGLARYELIAGPADADAVVRIGLLHAPDPSLLQCFADDGYDLVLAGHTHGGQVRVPFGPAIVTNCGIDRRRARGLHRWDESMWFNVSAGVGTSPYLPIRFACRPEASLLTLVPRG